MSNLGTAAQWAIATALFLGVGVYSLVVLEHNTAWFAGVACVLSSVFCLLTIVAGFTDAGGDD